MVRGKKVGGKWELELKEKETEEKNVKWERETRESEMRIKFGVHILNDYKQHLFNTFSVLDV